MEPSSLALDIYCLDLGIRAENALLNAGIYTLGDLVNKTRAELKVRNLGKRGLDEIECALSTRGLRLNMLGSDGKEVPIYPSEDPAEISRQIRDLREKLRIIRARERQRVMREKRQSSPTFIRNTEILAARKAGGTIASIAKQYGLSPQRIQQILARCRRTH